MKAARTKKVDDWNEFNRLRNKVNNTKFVEKRNYYSETLNKTKGNPKQMWRKLKELVPIQKIESHLIYRGSKYRIRKSQTVGKLQIYQMTTSLTSVEH